ncbi:MAG TPA: ASKHA domain-containing protein [Geomobilimonas sp.]|nr:ASKHA domain-containing protein [Geomobilimonas sp.]
MSSPRRLAIAIDLGTTTIAASLLDTATGERLAMAGGLNPQRLFGADVVSRLEAAHASADNRHKMSALVNGSLADLVKELLGEAGASPVDLTGVAIAGNPAMEHLLLGLPVESLAFPPYRPLFTAGRTMTTGELGWDVTVPAMIFPLPGGFVGGDLVAFLFGSEVTGPSGPLSGSQSPIPSSRLFLDLGTNGELALQVGEKTVATSAAAGPAFEGGNLACGMAALAGAIHRVTITGDRLELSVIGGGTPVGICGSGVIETIAGLLQAGVIDGTGRLLTPGEIPSNLANRVEEVAGQPAFVLYRDARTTVYLSQEDIRQVQLAKGAIRAGVEVLCERTGIRCDAVEEVILTGSFGAELSPRSLKNLGIFTENMVKIAFFVREGALRGVERALCAPDGFDRVARLAESIRVIPLSGTPAFEKHFLEQMNFP